MTKLARAPLQEAIFEIRWELDIDPGTNQMLDIGFSMAQGKLESIVKSRFPHHVRKLPLNFPDLVLQYQAIHQYWTGPENTWPVIQLGPGIFTINDTDLNYDWQNTYLPLIKEGLEWIYKAYDGKIKLNFANLRYIDSVKLKDYGFDGKWQEFIAENFNFSFLNTIHKGNLKGIQFDQLFELEDKSTLHFTMSSGKYRYTDQDALIWQTAVFKNDKFDKKTLLEWLDLAHGITSDSFKNLTKPVFYETFK